MATSQASVASLQLSVYVGPQTVELPSAQQVPPMMQPFGDGGDWLQFARCAQLASESHQPPPWVGR